jgi:hypothetical protein
MSMGRVFIIAEMYRSIFCFRTNYACCFEKDDCPLTTSGIGHPCSRKNPRQWVSVEFTDARATRQTAPASRAAKPDVGFGRRDTRAIAERM